MNPLIKLFESILPLSDFEKDLIAENIYLETFKKGERYCEYLQVCKKMGFVIEGVFKVMRSDARGNEYIQYFTSEGHFAVDLESYADRSPAAEKIEALTKCVVISITKDRFNLLMQSIPGFSKIIAQIKEKALLEKYLLKSEMVVDDAYTRYDKLVKRQPSIIQRIPQCEIASFLGITRYTLSRIRAQK